MRLLIILIILLITACSKDDGKGDGVVKESGVIVELPIIWSLERHETESGFLPTIVNNNITYDGNPILIFTEDENNRSTKMIDIETGDEIWSWNDTYLPDIETTDFRDYYRHDNLITWATGTRHYLLDLETGETVWKHRRDQSYYIWISGIGDDYFLTGPSDTLEEYYNFSMVHKGDFTTGELKPYLMYDEHVRSDADGRITTVINTECTIYNGVRYLLLDGRDPKPNTQTQRHFSLYNLDTEEWVYQKKPVGEVIGNNAGNIIIEDNRVYVATGKFIECHDLLTGSLIWQELFDHTFTFSGIVLHEDKIIGNCENSRLYALDKMTGKIIWRGEGSGTSTRLTDRILNNVLYFDGGAHRRIFAIDLSRGVTLWKLDSQRLEGNREYTGGNLYVIPGKEGEKGRVVWSSNEYFYCVEAAR
jgi:outer membrane protein assembly factor BamB